MTRVIFRKYKDNGEIIALFPDIVPSFFKRMSYMHFGQHSEVDYDLCIKCTKLATEEEYAPLLAELKSIGYDDLKVYKKRV